MDGLGAHVLCAHWSRSVVYTISPSQIRCVISVLKEENSETWWTDEWLGPIVRIAPDTVDVADVESVQRIYRIQGGFPKSKLYALALPNVENVFSTPKVDLHRRFRRLLSSPISESGLKPMYPQIASKVHLAIQLMGQEMETRGCTDISKWWLFMATDIIGELTFGESFRMLEIGQVCFSFLSDRLSLESTNTPCIEERLRPQPRSIQHG